MDRVDAFEGLSDRGARSFAFAHIDRPELHVESALANAGQIHVSVGGIVALGKRPTRIFETRRRIRVPVDHDRVEVEIAGRFSTSAEQKCESHEQMDPVNCREVFI